MTAFLSVCALSVCMLLCVLCCALSVRCVVLSLCAAAVCCCCVMHMLLLCSVSSADEGALVRFREALTESDGGGFTVRTEISIGHSHTHKLSHTQLLPAAWLFLLDSYIHTVFTWYGIDPYGLAEP